MISKSQEARKLFCNNAFEIAWIIEKATFLLKQVDATLKNWISVDYERILKNSTV